MPTLLISGVGIFLFCIITTLVITFNGFSGMIIMLTGCLLPLLMGKAAGVPVWQLVGQQQRAYVAVGSWTVSAEPAHMAEAVQRYAAQGYTWMKYHLSPFQNVIDQVEAIAAVAPPGFKLHLDFTMEPLEGHTYLCERLSECVATWAVESDCRTH